MKRLRRPVIYNSKGEPIRLTTAEQRRAEILQREVNEKYSNDLGYEIDITTLTTIIKQVTEQKFFEIAPADYLPVRVGEGAFSTALTTYRSFAAGGEFETGIINNGNNNARLATADAAIDALTIKVIDWAKTIGWTIFELEQAAKSGNWDLVAAKENARKKNWDLGIQRVAFLGARGLNASGGSCLGLMNQTGITVNSTTITKALKNMTPAELNTFQQKVIEDYRENCNRTAWPTHFIIPESDYNGLASQSSENFPIKSKLALLEEAFQVTTRNRNFKILPLAYGDAQYSGYSYQQYVLLNYDVESLRMDIPVDYTSTLANSLDNFSLQNVAYGQFTGVLAYRPLEMLYFQYNA